MAGEDYMAALVKELDRDLPHGANSYTDRHAPPDAPLIDVPHGGGHHSFQIRGGDYLGGGSVSCSAHFATRLCQAVHFLEARTRAAADEAIERCAKAIEAIEANVPERERTNTVWIDAAAKLIRALKDPS